MSLVVYSHKDSRYGFAEQPTYGTAVADGAAVIEANIEPLELAPDVKAVENQIAHGSREDTYGNLTVSTNLALPKFNIQGELNLNDIAHLIFAFFQTPSATINEGASTPFKKTFVRHLTQPDFTVNAGHYLTVFERDPVQAYKVKDCIVESLKLSFKTGEKVKFSAGLIGRGNPATCTPSGTWMASPTTGIALIDYFSRFTMNFNGAGAVSPKLGSFDLDLKRSKVEGVSGAAGVDFESLALGPITGTFDYETLKDANFITGRSTLLAGTSVAVRIGKGNATAGSVAGDFDIVHTGILSEVSTVKGDPMLGCHYKGRILAPDAATPGMTIVLADDIDRSW